MQPDWPKVIGELLAEHELAQRSRGDTLAARLAVLEARPTEKGDRGEPGPAGARGPQGEKGETGRDGRDASDLALLRNLIGEQVTALIGEVFKMASVTTPDGGRTLHVKLGDATHKVRTDIPLYAGAWKDGLEYNCGDGVSLSGSFWIAQTKTNAKPPHDDWRLAVRSGRDFRPDDKHPVNSVVKFK